MDELKECISKHAVNNVKEIENIICNMVCTKNDLIPLSEKNLIKALNIDGEFLALKLHYNNFEDELKSEKIKYKISQSLSVIVCYEDDSNSYDKIGNFTEYIHNLSDDKQNSIFGVKRVSKLSEYPITILFSGILPINQLKMTVGEKIYDLIHSDDEYFQPLFKKYRDTISEEVGVPILPLFPILDDELSEFHVRLVDQLDGRVISEFEVCHEISKTTLDVYLQKLVYVYKILIQEKGCKAST